MAIVTSAVFVLVGQEMSVTLSCCAGVQFAVSYLDSGSGGSCSEWP